MNKTLLLLLGVILFFSHCKYDKLPDPLDAQLRAALDRVSKTGSYEYYILPGSDDFSSIPNQDPNNPITAGKVALGKMLFHETGLASGAQLSACRETYSCSSCHIADAGFTPGRIQGIADGGIGFGANRQLWSIYQEDEIDAQGLRPLTILNVAYVTNTLWSGIFGAKGVNEGTEDVWEHGALSEVNFLGLEGLESQNIEGLPLHRLEISEKVLDDYGYRAHFDACFPDIPEEDRYNFTTASFALGAYLRTVLANKAPFQGWLKGDKTAMSDAEKRGALLFLGKARCYYCHNSPSFNSMNFYALGTRDLYHESGALNTSEADDRNLGRGFFTGKEEDRYTFKVPQLYNVEDYASYFHGSSKRTLREVLEFKINARSENENVSDEQLSNRFQPLELSEEEISDILEFLEKSLRDPDLQRYVPEEVLSGNCFPNNDPESRVDLGCD